MGVSPHVGLNRFPPQGPDKGQVVQVFFNYDRARWLEGTVIRDDRSGHYVLLIQLDDGRVILGSECSWSRQQQERVP